MSSPLLGPIGELEEDRYGELAADLADAVAGYVDDEGIVVPMQTWIVTAHRPVGQGDQR